MGEWGEKLRRLYERRTDPENRPSFEDWKSQLGKSQGEGSRGGKVVGHTASGKPKYAGGSGATSGSYQRQLLVEEKARRAKAGSSSAKPAFSPQAKEATSTAYIPRRPQYATIKSQAEGANMDKFDKLMKSMGVTVGEKVLIQKTHNSGFEITDFNTSGSRVGMVKSARERLYEQMGNVRERDIRKAFGDENIADQHAESWHMDGDKLVHKLATKAEEISTFQDQDSQREAASVVTEASNEKKLGVGPQAEKSFSDVELFIKAMGDEEGDEEEDGEFDSEEDEEGGEEEDSGEEEQEDAAKKDAKKKPKYGAKSEDTLDELFKALKGKGAKPLAHTPSGKPVMPDADHDAHDDYENDDHEAAFRVHTQKMREHQNYIYDLHSGEQTDEKRKLQSKLKDRVAHSDSQRIKHLGKIYKSVNAKLVDKLEKACAAVDMGEGKLKREAKKMEGLHENSPKVAEAKKPEAKKSEDDLDVLLDLIKATPTLTMTKKSVPAPVARRDMSNPFVKASGAGGIVMDFGSRTGNPHADQFTALLERHGDVTQKYIAADQAKSYEKALNDYVTQGDSTYMAKNNGPGVDLDTPMDKQVANEFAKAQTQANHAKKSFGQSTLMVGAENVQATSETDAALIEMMKTSGVDFSEK